MKKLKCTNCGGSLKISEDKQMATCPFCNEQYKLNEDLNININLNDNAKEVVNNGKKTALVMLIPFIIIFVFIIFIATTFIFKAFTTTSKSIEETNAYNTIDKVMFNGFLELYKGTNRGTMVKSLIDEIVTSNKKNESKVSVIFNDTKYETVDDIINIKTNIEKNKEYEVIFNYNDSGFIYESIIKALD